MKIESNGLSHLSSVLSCSVFEADDEHEVVSSTTIANRAGVSGTREKSPIETFNCLRSNFTVMIILDPYAEAHCSSSSLATRNPYYTGKFFLVVFSMVLQLN